MFLCQCEQMVLLYSPLTSRQLHLYEEKFLTLMTSGLAVPVYCTCVRCTGSRATLQNYVSLCCLWSACPVTDPYIQRSYHTRTSVWCVSEYWLYLILNCNLQYNEICLNYFKQLFLNTQEFDINFYLFFIPKESNGTN